MIIMQGKPGPAAVDPWLQSIAMRPMLCHQIGESETAFERYLEPDERPAADDRYDRQNERQLVCLRIGSGSRRALHRSAPRSEPREMPIAFAAFDIASRTDTVVGRGVSRRRSEEHTSELQSIMR